MRLDGNKIAPLQLLFFSLFFHRNENDSTAAAVASAGLGRFPLGLVERRFYLFRSTDARFCGALAVHLFAASLGTYVKRTRLLLWYDLS